MYCGYTTDMMHPKPLMDQQEFYCALAEQLIDNNIGARRNIRRNEWQNRSERQPSMNYLPELRITRHRKRKKNGRLSKSCRQGRCRICVVALCATVCSSCEDNSVLANYYCDAGNSINCFKAHIDKDHYL